MLLFCFGFVNFQKKITRQLRKTLVIIFELSDTFLHESAKIYFKTPVYFLLIFILFCGASNSHEACSK
jgi:hypothetical protein